MAFVIILNHWILDMDAIPSTKSDNQVKRGGKGGMFCHKQRAQTPFHSFILSVLIHLKSTRRNALPSTSAYWHIRSIKVYRCNHYTWPSAKMIKNKHKDEYHAELGTYIEVRPNSMPFWFLILTYKFFLHRMISAPQTVNRNRCQISKCMNGLATTFPIRRRSVL